MSRRTHMLTGRLESFLDAVRSSYWFIPVVMALGAGSLAAGLVEIDRTFTASLVDAVPWIAAGEPAGARAVLSVIAGSMITVTGVVFSITVVALTLASSQFGPRLLRNFLRDRTNQLSLGTFLATFLFSLVVLRTVRVDDVPHAASAAAVALAVISVFVLIYFIHHTATSIQASTVIEGVAQEIHAQIPKLFPDLFGKGGPSIASPEVQAALGRLRADGTQLPTDSDGFIRVVDQDAFPEIAVEYDLVIELLVRPGDFVFAGAALARVGPKSHVTEDILCELRECFVLGGNRTAVQDLLFLTGQLTEIALRALSPGVNDPRTAVDCVQRLGAVVSSVGGLEMGPGTRLDDKGRLRVVASPNTYEEIVASCFDPIRQYGAGHVDVVVAAQSAIGRAGKSCSDASRRRHLATHLVAMHEAFQATEPSSPHDITIVEESFKLGMSRLDAPE